MAGSIFTACADRVDRSSCKQRAWRAGDVVGGRALSGVTICAVEGRIISSLYRGVLQVRALE